LAVVNARLVAADEFPPRPYQGRRPDPRRAREIRSREPAPAAIEGVMIAALTLYDVGAALATGAPGNIIGGVLYLLALFAPGLRL
jgi:hypothetical protein